MNTNITAVQDRTGLCRGLLKAKALRAGKRGRQPQSHERFYEKVIKVKADVAAIHNPFFCQRQMGCVSRVAAAFAVIARAAASSRPSANSAVAASLLAPPTDGGWEESSARNQRLRVRESGMRSGSFPGGRRFSGTAFDKTAPQRRTAGD
jgi:hypothetical protein